MMWAVVDKKKEKKEPAFNIECSELFNIFYTNKMSIYNCFITMPNVINTVIIFNFPRRGSDSYSLSCNYHTQVVR